MRTALVISGSRGIFRGFSIPSRSVTHQTCLSGSQRKTILSPEKICQCREMSSTSIYTNNSLGTVSLLGLALGFGVLCVPGYIVYNIEEYNKQNK